MVNSSRQGWAVALESLGVVALALGLGIVAYRIAGAVDSPGSVAVIVAALPVGYLLADVAAGTAHWFCDTFFDEDTPVIGAALILGFREHHRDPASITRHDFLELNGSSCLAVTPLWAALTLIDPGTSAAHLAVVAVSATLAASASATNQLHRWAHEPVPPPLARLMQRVGLILSPAHHAVHHTAPYARHYCVTNGWANALLERVDAWRTAERLVRRLGVPAGGHHPAPTVGADRMLPPDAS